MKAPVVGRRLRRRRTAMAASSSSSAAAFDNNRDEDDAPPSAPGALDAEWQALLSSRAAAGLGGEPASEDDGGPDAMMMPPLPPPAESDSGPQSGVEAVGGNNSSGSGGPGAAAVGHSWPSSSSASASSVSADDTYDWLDEAGYTPFPSNLPADVGGGFGGNKDSKDLGSSPVSSFLSSTAFSTSSNNNNLGASSSEQQLLSWQHTSTPVATPPLPWELSPRTVFVILFGVGGAMGTEGIYALRAVVSDEEAAASANGSASALSSSAPPPAPSLDADAPLPHDTIVAFECEDDALRYASQLEAAGMDKHAPSVSAIDSAELLDFCSDAGYDARLEARNTSLLPPECSVGLTDWERSARLRRGAWSVLPSDPEFGEVSSSSASASPPSPSPSPAAPRSPSPSPPSTPLLRNNAGAYPAGGSGGGLNHLSPLAAEGDAALAELRAMLERLLESSPSSSSSPSNSSSPSGPNSSDAASSWATDDFEGDDLDVV